MKEINYKLLKVDDISDYRRVRFDCLKHYPNNFGPTLDAEIRLEKLKFENAISNNDNYDFVFGAFTIDKKLIGICGFVREKRLKTLHRGEITQMYVAPDFSGQGIGKKLLKCTIDKAFKNKEIEQITLGVVLTNDKAIRIYQSLGFVEYGRFENYFKTKANYFTQVLLRLDADLKTDWWDEISDEESTAIEKGLNK